MSCGWWEEDILREDLLVSVWLVDLLDSSGMDSSLVTLLDRLELRPRRLGLEDPLCLVEEDEGAPLWIYAAVAIPVLAALLFFVLFLASGTGPEVAENTNENETCW